MNTNIQARPQVQTQKQEQEVKRTYKDSVFVTIFHDKSKLIELYNALFNTNYDESAPIDIVTIKDVLFRTLKNDLAFVLGGRFVVLVEHQSSINENMPLRDLMYISTVLKRMIDTTRLYREKRLMIPRPSFVVLYNGTKDFPAYQELRLSDSFLGEKQKDEEDALQLIVKVYNINTEKNSEILDKYGTEIVEMLFKELTREEDLEISRLDGYEEGERAGFSKGERAGAEQKQCEIAKSLRESGIPIDVIAKNTGLSEKEIAEL